MPVASRLRRLLPGAGAETVELDPQVAIRVEQLAKVYHPAAIKLHAPPTSVVDRMLKRRGSGDIAAGDDGADDGGSDDDDSTGLEDLPGEVVVEVDTPTEVIWGIRDATFEIPRGQVVAVVGPPKSGKTTLLNVLSGLDPPSAGRVIVRGRIWPTTKYIAAFLAPGFTIKQNAVLAGKLGEVSKRDVLDNLDRIYELLHVRPSGVMRATGSRTRQVALALGMIAEPDIVLLDHPALPNDDDFRDAAVAWLERARARGATILVEQPDQRLLDRLCTHVMTLDNGRVVEIAPKADLPEPDSEQPASEDASIAFPRRIHAPGHGMPGFTGIAAIHSARAETEDEVPADYLGLEDTLVVRITIEVALFPATIRFAVALTRDDGLRVWIEQPDEVDLVRAGLQHTFARVPVSDIPSGRYLGHVEAIVDNLQRKRAIGRTGLFAVELGGSNETVSDSAKDAWYVVEGTWSTREPLSDTSA